MGFLLPVRFAVFGLSVLERALKPPFDIAGDLDTPVSAFMKLASFAPRFLLESVEGGERLARYSFIGFGNGLEVRLDRDGFTIGGERRPIPSTRAELLAGLRTALQRAPQPQPDIAGVPLAGGLVGYSSYDVVRFFERLSARTGLESGVPALHYVAPRSLLVFDHLTRGIALVHAGSEEERRSLRNEVVRALRGGLPNHGARGKIFAAGCRVQSCRLHEWCQAYPGVHRGRRRLSAGSVRAFRGSSRARSLPSLPRATTHQSLALHVLLRTGRCHCRRLVARGVGEAERRSGAATTHRGNAAPVG